MSFSAATALGIFFSRRKLVKSNFRIRKQFFCKFCRFLRLFADFSELLAVFCEFSQFPRVFYGFLCIFTFGASKRSQLAPHAFMAFSAVRLLVPRRRYNF